MNMMSYGTMQVPQQNFYAQQAMYQQPMQMGGYPQQMQAQPQPMMMNNYPVQGQPVNVTQTGVPFDVLRTEIATLIAQRQAEDPIMQAFAIEAAGPNQNWLTGQMDTLTETCGRTIDYLYRMQPGTDVNYLRQQCVQEVVNLGWARRLRDNPTYQNDPSIQPKLGLFNQCLQLMQTRANQLTANGMNANYAPQNVNPYMTQSAMMNQYANQYQMYPQTMGRPMSQQIPGVNPMQLGNNYQQGVALNRPDVNQHREVGNNLSLYNIREKLLGEQAKANNVAPTAAAPSQLQQSMQFAAAANNTVANVNHVPAQQSQFANLPQTHTQQPVMTGQQVAQSAHADLAKEWMKAGQTVSTTQTYQSSKQFNNFDINDTNAVTDVFKAAIEDERKEVKETLQADRKGLHDDEVRVLKSRKEVAELVEQGHLFESPYTRLLAANPNQVYHHAILTKAGKIRQLITQKDDVDSMRIDKHLCLLDDVRNSDIYKQDKNAMKEIDVTYYTSRGGVVFDRFKQSAVVLHSEIAKIPADLKEEDRIKAVNEAFTKFNEQVEKDKKEYFNGLHSYRFDNAEEHANMDPVEVQDEIDILFKPEMLEEIEKQSEKKVKIHKDDIVYEASNVAETLSEIKLRELEEGKPQNDDAGLVSISRNQGIYYVFNDVQEARAVKELLSDFFWLDNPTKEYTDRIRVSKLSATLKEIRKDLPPALYHRINNYATEIFNDGLRYICAFDNGFEITMDSFVDDFKELVDYLNESGKFDEYVNLDIALRTVTSDIILALQQFRDSIDVSVNVGETDMVQERALAYDKYDMTLSMPVMAESLGLTDKVNAFTYVSNKDMHDTLSKLYALKMNSRVDRKEYSHPICNLYVTTLEGKVFKVYPRLGDAVYVSSERNDFFSGFTLVRQPAIN